MYNHLHEDIDQHRLQEFASNFKRTNIKERNDWKLNVTRLEDGWFMFKLIQHFGENATLHCQDFNVFTGGNRRDIESLCKIAILQVTTQAPKWVHHQCDIPGCEEGMVMVDGNEKVKRAMCAAPVKCDVNHINLVQCCINSPLTGGKHQQASRYCACHQDLDFQSLIVSIPLPFLSPSQHSVTAHVMSSVEHISPPNCLSSKFTEDSVGELPDVDCSDQLVGCRKSKNVTKYFDRTAGTLAAVRPCGIVVNFREMYTCESPTQVYVFLIITFCHGHNIKRLQYVAYD